MKGLTLNTNSNTPEFIRMSPDAPYRNVEQIRAAGTRVICGTVPAQVRKELREAVKIGWLGHLRKNGLAPEIYFHPSHKNGAIELQKREFEYAVNSINGVCVCPEEKIDNMLKDREASMN